MTDSVQNSKVVIECPRCHFQKAIDTDECVKRSGEIRLKIKCRCGEIFQALLEKQMYSRSAIGSKGHVVIEDLSEILSGLSVSIQDINGSGVHIETDYPELFRIGNKVMVKIYCGNSNGAFISKDGTVENINRNSIGIHFTHNGPEWNYRYGRLDSEDDKTKFDRYLYL